MSEKGGARRIAAQSLAVLLLLSWASWNAYAQESLDSLRARNSAMEEIISLVERSHALQSSGDVDAAQPLIERALKIAETSLGAEDFWTAMMLNELAGLLDRKNDTGQALQLYERSLAITEKAIREQVRGVDEKTLVQPLGGLASLYAKKGDYVRAEAFYLRKLAIEERTLGADDLSISFTLNFLAQLYHKQLDYKRAEPLYLRAIRIREKKSDAANDMSLAVVLNNLATMYSANGDYARAEAAYKRAIDLYTKIPEEERLLAQLLDNYSAMLRVMGEYTRAEPLVRRALEIRERALGAEHPDTAESLNNLANLLSEKGDYVHAEPLFLLALAIREKTVGAAHKDVAPLLNNLALIYQYRKDYEKAESFFRRSIMIYEATLGAHRPETIAPVNNLGVMFWELGDFARAEPLLQRTLTVREKALGVEHPDTVMALHNMAGIYDAKGDYFRAEPLYRRALDLFEKTLGANHPLVANTLNNLATLKEATSQTLEAVRLASRAAEIRERSIRLVLTTGTEDQKFSYMLTLARETDYAISLHLRAAPDDKAAARLAHTTLLRRKGRVLDAMVDQNELLRRRANSQDLVLLDKLTSARARLAKLVLAEPGSGAPLVQLQTQTAQLAVELERIEAEAGQHSSELRQQLSEQTQAVTPERVQAAMPGGTALVEIVSYRPYNTKAKTSGERFGAPRYAAYVLHRTRGARWAELGEASEIDSLVRAFRTLLADPQDAGVREAARRLDERIMRPVRRLLGETNKVFISPDGSLNLVPFAALVDETNRFLIERYTFTYLTSGRDLLRIGVNHPNKNQPIVFAAPAFDESDDTVSNQTSAAGSARGATQNLRSADLSAVWFSPLPGTAEEARALAHLLPNAQILSGSQATESRLKAVRSPAIVHIATHGFFLPKQQPQANADPRSRGFITTLNAGGERTATNENPLLRSGLALAGANGRQGGAGEDGILTALEAAGLDLRGTKLVVLSACETGVGETAVGEGVYGLRRALVLAGAESALMTLWQVSDEATRELMSDYYRKLLSGAGRTEGLRQVQLAMLRRTETSHPFFWASFIQSGAWQSVSITGGAVLPGGAQR